MTKTIAIAQEVPLLGGDWFDPLEAGVRRRIRSFIEGMLEEELAAALGRGRYDRSPGAAGYRNGHRDRQLLGTFGPVAVSVPRARQSGGDGKPEEWRSKTLHVGIASGPVMAGIIGRTRFSYDVWGDTVNLAARLEAWGRPGNIVASAGVEASLRRSHAFEPLGSADLKGIGKVEMFRLLARKPDGGPD
jgi:hypothetical protein